MPKYLVTGDRGFIASHLCPALMSNGIELQGIDINAEAKSVTGVKGTIGDIRNPIVVKEVMKNVEAVFHLAAAHKDFGVKEHEYFDVNENGTRVLLNSCDEYGIKKFIFYSSVAVYGMQRSSPNEEAEPRPESPYGKSKLAAELLINNWASRGQDRKALIIRPTVVFGPGNKANMYSLIKQVMGHRFLFVGDGNNIKSIAYVENLVSATLFLSDRLRRNVEVFNYTDEPQLSTKRIVDIISHHAEVWVPPLRIPLKATLLAGKILDQVAHITGRDLPITGDRIRKFCTETKFDSKKVREIGFVQPIPLDEGFRRMIEWMRNT